MNDFQVDLGDGRSIVVNAGSPEEAAGAARNFLSGEKGTAQGKDGETFGSKTLGYIDNLMRQAANGVTFGYADEISSALDNLTGRSNSYGEALAKNRAQDKAFEEENPYAAGGAKLAGNVATAALALPAIPAGGSMLGNALRYGTAGAGLGAAQGFGEGEGGFANRATSAAVGAGLGAAGGAVIPVAGQVVNKGVEALGAPLLRKLAGAVENFVPRVAPQSLGAAAPEGGSVAADSLATRLSDALTSKAGSIEQNAALRNLAGRMVEQKSTPGSLTASLQDLGPQATLADLGDSFLSAANGARLDSREVRTLANQVLTERSKQYGSMLTEAGGATDVPSIYTAGRAFDENARQVGNDLYGQMRSAGVTVSPEMQSMIDTVPRVKNALQQITEDAAQNGRTIDPADLMHKVKEALNQKASKIMQSDTYMDKAGLGDLANQWEQAFWKANPAALKADQAYQVAKSLPDYMDLGRRFMQEGTAPGQVEASAPSVADWLSGAVPHQQGAYTLGVQNAVRSAAEINPTNLARNLTPEKQGIVEKLTRALGPGGQERVMNAANAVRTFQATKNALTGGSTTATNLADEAAIGNTRFNLTPEGIHERITEHARDLIAKLEEPSEGTLNKLGELLLTPNPEENARTIEMLKKILAARARSSTTRAAVGASAADTLERP